MKSSGNSVCRENTYCSPVQPRHYSPCLVIRHPCWWCMVWWQQQSPPQPSVRVTVRWSVRQMAAQSPPVPRPGHTTTSSSGQFLPVSWSQLLSHRHRATDRSLAELSPVDSGQCWRHGGPGPQPSPAHPAQARVLSS